ncbi:hypothetical protein N9414_03423 [Nodularia spumigena CCY9414]|nr:hypothetical protein N9414_03423 [Nodularia spumigena CCY9414]
MESKAHIVKVGEVMPRFPSPLGEEVMERRFVLTRAKGSIKVSIPVRGRGYGKEEQPMSTWAAVGLVSIPVRGRGYGKLWKIYIIVSLSFHPR